MNITIFGATGMVGKLIVRYGIALGHMVTAFGRNVDNLIDEDLRNDNLVAIKGSVFNELDVHNAIANADMVISVLGGSVNGEDKTRSLGLKTIVHAMEKSGLKRIVALGGLGVLNDGNGKYLLDGKDYPEEFKKVGNEHLQAYLTLKESNLDWTFVCPPTIKENEATGNFMVSATIAPHGGLNYIAAGDLALFILYETIKKEYVHLKVGIVATI